jgi:GWxTD domain-containing protein
VRRDPFRSPLILQGILFALLLSSCGVFRPQWGGTERAPATPVFIEARNLISVKPGMSRLDVGVRVPLNFFVFVRARTEPDSAAFLARTDIAVEVLDKAHASVARLILRREFPSPVQSPPPGPDRFIEKLFSFDLPPGRYTVATEVSDLESSRKFMDRTREIELKDFSLDSLRCSDLLFLSAPLPDSGAVSPASFGENLPFGRTSYGYLEFMSPAPVESIRASYAIQALPPEREAHTSSRPESFQAARISRSRLLNCVKTGEEYSYRVGASAVGRRVGVWFTENGDTLPEGNYDLETLVSDGARSSSRHYPIRIRWIDMPRSLRNIPQAIEVLRYIASDSEVDEMRSAPQERQRALLNLFWKKRDPTPGTVFNEQMEEFYRRVDYAMENFGSLREPNGMRTDRGRAHILYGPPGSIERNLRPGSDPEEIWIYPKLHKRLLFIDRDHHGDYRLSETGETR